MPNTVQSSTPLAQGSTSIVLSSLSVNDDWFVYRPQQPDGEHRLWGVQYVERDFEGVGWVVRQTDLLYRPGYWFTYSESPSARVRLYVVTDSTKYSNDVIEVWQFT